MSIAHKWVAAAYPPWSSHLSADCCGPLHGACIGRDGRPNRRMAALA